MALDNGHPAWLNLPFVEKILQNSEKDSSIQVIDMFLKPATDKGDNYTSDMYRVTVEYSDKNHAKTTERKTILFKLAPTQEGKRKDIVIKGSLFECEMSMMMDTLKKMNNLLGYERRLSATCMYAQQEFPVLLALEDLALSNFRLADRQAGLDLDHSLLAIRGLARFHAASVALCEKEPCQKALYEKGMFNSKNPPEFDEFFITQTKTLAHEIADWPELGKKYSDKIAKLSDYISQKGMKLFERDDNEFNVINHGDYWVNNMMFKYNDEGRPIDHICVDFQLSVYTSPAIDLHYFLSTSPSVEVITNNKKTLLERYRSTLSAIMKELNCKTQPPTMGELENIMKRRAAYGMIASFSILPIVLCDKDKVKDLDEVMGKDGYHHPAYKGVSYRKIMSERIPIYNEMGFLDL